MATKIIKALIDGAVQEIEVEYTTSPEQGLSVEDRLIELEDKPIITDGNFLVGNGTEEMEEITPDEVLSHINGASVATMTTAEYEALETAGTTNANTLYMLTDAEEESHTHEISDVNGLQEELDSKLESVPNATTSTAGLMSAVDKSKANYTNIAYGTCSTAAATAAKVVTISGNTNWSLTVGSIICVNFTAVNTAANPTFNVNGTGAKPVSYDNTAITTTNLNRAGHTVPQLYVYNGEYYVWMGHSTDWNTTYSNQSLGNGYGTCATAAATAAKVVTLSSYSLVAHGMVSVKFTYAVPASATLNINSKGAKAIYHNGAAITAGVINAGDIATFIYDGSYYQLIAVDRTNINYTATITTTWTGSAAPYSQSITVTGITANDKPIVDVTMSGTYATDQARLEDWGKIYRIVTAANKITVYATEKTSVALPIQLQVVR